jgi:hypothetical protein
MKFIKLKIFPKDFANFEEYQRAILLLNVLEKNDKFDNLLPSDGKISAHHLKRILKSLNERFPEEESAWDSESSIEEMAFEDLIIFQENINEDFFYNLLPSSDLIIKSEEQILSEEWTNPSSLKGKKIVYVINLYEGFNCELLLKISYDEALKNPEFINLGRNIYFFLKKSLYGESGNEKCREEIINFLNNSSMINRQNLKEFYPWIINFGK